MTWRYLFGPMPLCHPEQLPIQDRAEGRCLTFGREDADLLLQPNDTWESLLGQCPEGWAPDALVVHLAYQCLPSFAAAAPVPLIGLAWDANLLWSHYTLEVLSLCDLILADAPTCERLQRQGLNHVQPCCLFGLGQTLAEAEPVSVERDLDVLFVGNMHGAVQRERMAWLGRLANLASRWRVHIASGVFGQEYHNLLRRSRIVFNRGIRGEANLRCFEAAGCGTLLFQEEDNQEIRSFFELGKECVLYNAGNLESLLDYYLEHEEERVRIATSAQQRVKDYSFQKLWGQTLEHIQVNWPTVMEHRRQRKEKGLESMSLPARVIEMQLSSDAVNSTLMQELTKVVEQQPKDPALHNALGVLILRHQHGENHFQESLTQQALAHFRAALGLEPGNLLFAVNEIEALLLLRQGQAAALACRRLLARMGRLKFEKELNLGWQDPLWRKGYDLLRVEWERAGWDHAGSPLEEQSAKCNLLRWHLHSVLAELTQDLVHYQEAALLRPGLPSTRANLGCALARNRRVDLAVPHLRFAVEQQPFDRSAARALYQALLDTGAREEALELAEQRRWLHNAAPMLLGTETWLLSPTTLTDPVAPPLLNGPPRRQTVGLYMIVKNEEKNLFDCVNPVRHLFDAIHITDTGSTDRTREIAVSLGAQVFEFPWCDSFAAARNASMAHANTDWIFWLDADDRVDARNIALLQELFSSLTEENLGYSLKCLCTPDRDNPSPTVVDHVRLFRNHPKIRWTHRVHEQILPAIRATGGQIRFTTVTIQHVGYVDRNLRKRKVERDLRLLHLELPEMGEHPFTLFNLGTTYLQELGDPAKALPYLQQSLRKSHVTDSIVRKLFSLIATCHRRLNQMQQALETYEYGRRHYPEDGELLFNEGSLRLDLGDLEGAISCYSRLESIKPQAYFASVFEGLYTYMATHHLGLALYRKGRVAEAESCWKKALQANPRYLLSWRALADLYVQQSRWQELWDAIRALEQFGEDPEQVARLKQLLPGGWRPALGA